MATLRFICIFLMIIRSLVTGEIINYWERIEVTSDGPVMVGTPITFTAIYKPMPESDGNHTYKFVFEDEIRGEAREIITSDTTVSQTYTFHADELTQYYPLMNVRIYHVIYKSRYLLVGRKEVTIEIIKDITGTLEIYQDNVPNSMDIIREKPVTMIAKINDPSGYFNNNWNVSYRWIVDSETLQSTNQHVSNYTFKTNGFHNVIVFVTAINIAQTQLDVNTSAANLTRPQKFGHFDRYACAGEPIRELKVKGKRVLDDGKLSLTVTCQTETRHFEWCWRIFDVANKNQAQNFDCDVYDLNYDCYFYIDHTFPNIGTYYMGFLVKNIGGVKREFFVIQVLNVGHDLPKTGWTCLYWGITLIVMAIIVAGLGIHYRLRCGQRGKRTES